MKDEEAVERVIAETMMYEMEVVVRYKKGFDVWEATRTLCDLSGTEFREVNVKPGWFTDTATITVRGTQDQCEQFGSELLAAVKRR